MDLNTFKKVLKKFENNNEISLICSGDFNISVEISKINLIDEEYIEINTYGDNSLFITLESIIAVSSSCFIKPGIICCDLNALY